MANLDKNNPLEKIYTKRTMIEDMLDLLREHYKGEITEFLEPCAGSGNMINVIKEQYPGINILGYDILNETGNPDIIEADFLKLKGLEYKKGRVCIINPPFTRATKFLAKVLTLCDYCISITSSSTILNLDWDKYDADFIHVYRKGEFEGTKKKFSIAIMGLKNK